MANQMSLANSLSKYSGEGGENLDFFLNNLEQLAHIEKWNDNKKCLFLKLNLSGKALNVISETKLSSNNEYNEIVDILRNKFSKKLSYSEIQNQFQTLTQKPNQSIKSLIEDVDKITNRYLDIDNNSDEQSLRLASKMKAQKLLDSMQPEIIPSGSCGTAFINTRSFKFSIIKQGCLL